MDHPASMHQTVPVNTGSATLDCRDVPDRKISLHERTSANKRYINRRLRHGRIGLIKGPDG